jgi:AcrR family transcriptional regulator
MEPGLRERKKEATREGLHEAALALAAERGADRVTIEDIADAAGVSRRTFSNYFGSKEEALLYRDQVRLRMLLDLIRARPARESAWTALTNGAFDLYARVGERDPGWLAETRLVRTHPSLAGYQVAAYHALERDLAEHIATRLPEPTTGVSDPDRGMRARLMAAAYLSALRIALRSWLDRPSGPTLPDVLRDALTTMGQRFR